MSERKNNNDDERRTYKYLLLAFVLAVVIIVVTAVILVSSLLAATASAAVQYRRVEFAAPPTSIPGTAFGWNICSQNANSTVTCMTENEHAQTGQSTLPPIVIGNGEDANQTSTAPPIKHPSTSGQPPIVVFGG